MIDVCSTVEVGTEVLPLTDGQADQILDRVRGLNERGMRGRRGPAKRRAGPRPHRR